MSDHVIGGIGLRACAELLMDLVEGAQSLSVRDASGTVLWHHEPGGESVVDPAVWLTPAEPGWRMFDDHVYARPAIGSKELLACAIENGEDEPLLYLCLLHEKAALPNGTTSRQDAHRAIIGLGQLLGTHYTLNHELNLMTDELVRRYEELNLVYNVDEEVHFLHAPEAALEDIIESCTSHLNVDVAALFLVGNETIIAQTRDDLSGEPQQISIELLRRPMIRWMAALRSSIVLNTAQERSTSGLQLPGTEKIVASPVRDRRGRLLGVLTVVNHANNRDFENGDRNLLTVMAEKVSKIVRANYDGLTGLITREGFEQAITDFLPDAKNGLRSICLMHANIDQLQLVNDTFGHDIGDDLIQQIASALKLELRDQDRIARLGGDEFGIILVDCTLEDATLMAERACEAIAKLECRVGARNLDVGISVGVARIEADVESVVGAMAAADLACLVAKEQGRSRAFAYHQNDKKMQRRENQMHWVGRIQRAIKSDRFELFSQVIAPTDHIRDSEHYEILLRMVGAGGKLLSPGEFMPVAERYHLMPSIDRWVIRNCLEVLASMSTLGLASQSVFAINLSGQSLTDERTLEFLVEELKNTPVNTGNLCFEITERETISNLAAAQHFIASVKSFGCRFALDDFGAGVTSFANLKALDLDYLKIDGSFVVDLATDPVSAAIVAAINQVGQTMQLKTVAEFVESSEIQRILCDLGVDFLQGYHIGKPRPFIEQLQELSKVGARSA